MPRYPLPGPPCQYGPYRLRQRERYRRHRSSGSYPGDPATPVNQHVPLCVCGCALGSRGDGLESDLLGGESSGGWLHLLFLDLICRTIPDSRIDSPRKASAFVILRISFLPAIIRSSITSSRRPWARWKSAVG